MSSIKSPRLVMGPIVAVLALVCAAIFTIGFVANNDADDAGSGATGFDEELIFRDFGRLVIRAGFVFDIELPGGSANTCEVLMDPAVTTRRYVDENDSELLITALTPAEAATLDPDQVARMAAPCEPVFGYFFDSITELNATTTLIEHRWTDVPTHFQAASSRFNTILRVSSRDRSRVTQIVTMFSAWTPGQRLPPVPPLAAGSVSSAVPNAPSATEETDDLATTTEIDDLAPSDQEMVDALLYSFDLASGLFVGSYDDECMARATVFSVGGAAELASRFGINPTNVDETMDAIWLPSTAPVTPGEAAALTDAYFECGLGEFLLGELGFLGDLRPTSDTSAGAVACLFDTFDMTLLRNWWNALYLDDTDRFEQLDAEFTVEEAEVLEICNGSDQSDDFGFTDRLNALWADCDEGSDLACDVMYQLSEQFSISEAVA